LTALPEPDLDELAGAVLDGDDVDWTEAESTAAPAARPLVQFLQVVAMVARVHWDDAPNGPESPLPDRWGHLRLLERVGRGAFGEVFRAWETRLDREVALKLLPAEADRADDPADAIIHEGRLLARVRHPNVVAIYGAERIGGEIGLWMEFVRGRSLEEVLREGTEFSPADAIAIGVELCRAVAAVHAAGVLHRDIKAHNVIRSDDGRVVLMDFGTGRELADDSSSDMTGTPLYLAPEVLAGGAATERSDVYSLGVLLHHLLSRSYPVRGRTVGDVRIAHEKGDRQELLAVRPDAGAALASVIARATDPDPLQRHAGADALAADLTALAGRRRIRRRVVYAAAAAVLVTASVLFAVMPADPFDDPAIAVLPFRNASIEPGGDLLVDSLTTGLIQQLAVIEGLEVRSQTSSFALRDAPRDLDEIARRLGVNLVVEGSAVLAAGALRVNVALVSTADDTPVWTDTLDRSVASAGDLTGVIDEIARTVASRLSLRLSRTQRRYDNIDLSTYEAYLTAGWRKTRRGPDALGAIPLYQEVIRREPGFAPAYAELATTYGTLALLYPIAGGFAMAPDAAVDLMQPLVDKALELDPELAEGHAGLAYLHALESRWAEAEASFRRAIALDPSRTSVHGDLVLSTLWPWGRVDEALGVMQAALDMDPLSLDARRILATIQLSAGRFDEALASCEQILAVDALLPFAEEWCGRALVHLGRTDEGLDRFGKNPERNQGWIGYVYAVTGRRDDALAIAARNDEMPQRQALIYAGLGDADRAFAALERLAALNPRRAGSYLTYPELASLRGDPRVAALRRSMGFPE
jgi:serine/threonine-protein kinase